MKKAAFYARVSSIIQREEHTIESQIVEIKRQIVEDKNVLVKEYVDDGYTGTRLDRPALEQLREDLKTNQFDVVYFLCADRIARDVWLQNIVIDDILKHKKRLIIGGKDYENNPENYFELTVLGAVSQLERAKIVERTTRGRLHKLRLGEVTSQGSNRIYGYRYVRKTDTTPPALVIYEPEAKIIRRIFEMRASERGVHKIARWLERNKIPTRMGKATWEANYIRIMLENHTYAGTRYYNRFTTIKEPVHGKQKSKYGRITFRQKKEWIPVKVPAIVSEELFEKVQEQIQKDKGKYRQPQSRQLLSELVRCGECGYSISSQRRRLGVWLKTGIRRIYHKVAYKCVRRQKANAHVKGLMERCTNPEINTHILEGKVFAIIRETMLDAVKLRGHMDFFKKNYRTDQKRVEWRIMRLENKKKDLEKKKKRLIDAYVTRQMTQQEYMDRNIELDQELLKIKLKEDELFRMIPLLHKKSVVEVSIRQFCDRAKARLEKCNDFGSKRQFVLDHIGKIILYRDKIIIRGAVPLRLSDRDQQDENEGNKISFAIEDTFDKKTFRKKTREQYFVDSRLKEWGSGGRDKEVYKARLKELNLPEVRASQITQQTTVRPLRDGFIPHLGKSYIEIQKVWNKDRETLMSEITSKNKVV